MEHHGEAGLQDAHDLSESRGAGVEAARGTDSPLRRLVVELHHVAGHGHGLVDDHVGVLGVFERPLRRHRVAAVDDLVSVPFEGEADGTVSDVDGRPGAHRHTVLLVDDLVLALVVELMNRDLCGYRVDHRRTGHIVPVIGLQEVLDGVLGAHVGAGTARPPDLQRVRSARRPAPGPESGEIAPVVRVQMTDEDLRQEVHRDHHRGDIGHRARTDVEQEFVTISKFQQEAARSLPTASGGQPRAACGNSDLIRFECLGTGVIDITVRRCSRGRFNLTTRCMGLTNKV